MEQQENRIQKYNGNIIVYFHLPNFRDSSFKYNSYIKI